MLHALFRFPIVPITFSLVAAVHCTPKTSVPDDAEPSKEAGALVESDSDASRVDGPDSAALSTELDPGSTEEIQSTVDHLTRSLDTLSDSQVSTATVIVSTSMTAPSAQDGGPSIEQDATTVTSEEPESQASFTGDAKGVVAQQPFTAAGGLSYVLVDMSRPASAIRIELSNLTDYCSKARVARTDGVATGNTRVVSLVVVNLDDTNPPMGTFEVDYQPNAGTLEASTGVHAGGFFGSSDSMCISLEHVDAVSGTIEVSEVSESSIKGAFALSFPGEDMVAGTFDAPRCDDVLELSVSDDRTCVQ